jgi:hypothetical protein
VIAGLGGFGAVAGLAWGARSFTVHLARRAMRLTLIATVTAVLALAGLGWTFVRLAQYSEIAFLAELATTLNPGFLVALPAAIVLGLAFTVSRVGARAVLSETAPAMAQGKIFAVQSAITDVIVIVPLLGIGAMTGYAGPRAALILVAALGTAMFILLEWGLPRFASSSRGAMVRTRPYRGVAPSHRDPSSRPAAD